jgi:RecA-family ATPase
MPNLNLRQLSAALGGEIAGGNVLAPGPGHSPADRSMSVRLAADAPDGFVVHSFAGDDALACKDYIRQRCGQINGNGNGHNGARRPRATRDEIAQLFAAAVQQQRDDSRPRGKLTAAYDYTDAAGDVLYQVLRFDQPKTFRQRRPDGNGGWVWKLDERRVLYRLPELLRYPDGTIFLTEGEKDADRVAGLNLCGTTVASGVWRGVDIEPLRDRDVIILQDNDTAGAKRALEAAMTLHGVAKTIRVVLLPGLADGEDVSDWLDADSRRAGKDLVDVCFDTPLWELPEEDTNKEHEVPPCSPSPSPPPPSSSLSASSPPSPSLQSSQSDKTTEKPAAELPPLAFTNPPTWEGEPVTDREWIVPGRMPTGGVTLLSGDGGVGKTILALQLSAAVALGRDWLNTMPDPGPVMVVCCEDDIDELHRRYFQIIAHYGARFADLANLHVLSLAGQDALLAAPSVRGGIIQPTKLFARLQQSVRDMQPRLIILDNSADVYAGSENDRAQVRQFITLLRSLVVRADSGVLLTSHPSLTGMATGTGLSGSTAWNASVRSRIYLRRVTTEKDEEPDPDLRMIEVMKSNYGPVGETVTIRWKDGVFLPEASLGSLEALAKEKKADEVFITLLDRLNGRGENVSPKRTANMFAPTVFAKATEAKTASLKKKDFEGALERLLEAKKIHLAPYGSPSRGTTKLVTGAPPDA